MTTRYLLLLCLLATAGQASAQVLYLSPYTGNGSEATPFKAHGVGQGAECKSLRPDETQLAGYAICEGPVVPVAPGIIDLTGKRAVTKADRDTILSDRGLSVSATSFDELLGELVDKQNVRLKRKAGRERIFVKGHEVWSRPAPLRSYLRDLPDMVASLFKPALAWAAPTLTETWTCADDATTPFVCDSTWVLFQGAVAGVVSNTFRTVNSVAAQYARSSTSIDATDMQGTVEVVSIDRGTATEVYGGVMLRKENNATSTFVFCALRDAATDQVILGHVVSGAVTEDSTTNRTVTNGDTVTARAVDDQLSCYHGPTLVLGPITESTGDGNLNGGVIMDGSGTGTTTLVVLDNWSITNNIPSEVRRRHLVLP